MANATGNHGYSTWTPVTGLLLLAIGLGVNYLLDRHNVFMLWEQSGYQGSWSNVVYPHLCAFLVITGGLMLLGAAMRGPWVAIGVAIPLTALYSLLFFAVQFAQTGADRFGECPGLSQAVSSTQVIPTSKVFPGNAEIGCGVERRGMFLALYNDMSIYGVTDPVAQEQVLKRITEHYRQAHTHSVRVRFYEDENWSVQQGRNGVAFGSRGPEKLIRVASVG